MSNLSQHACGLLAVVALGGCHLGQPPLAGPFQPGPVVALSAEPGLTDALRASLAAALAERGMLGGEQPLSVEVLTAEAASLAAGSAAQQWQARLVVAVTAAGPVPRRVVVQGARSFAVGTDDPLAAAAARTQAFSALSQELMADAVAWHLLHPSPESP